MFRLDEAFEASWEQVLQESTRKNLETIVEDLDAEREAAERSFDIVNEYLTICADCAILESTGAGLGGSEGGKAEPAESDILGKLASLLKNVDGTAPNEDKTKAYSPVPGVSLTQDFHSFKFPQNIIFLIGRIIDWVKRVVIYFVRVFENTIKGLLGAQTTDLSDAEKDIKLRFTKTKELEKIVGLQALPNGASKVKFATAYAANPKDIQSYAILGESFINEDATLEKNPADRQIVISVDMSKDLLTLEQLLQHFMDLFDNSLGSNGEHLFDTADLELMLKVFKDTLADIKDYRIGSYEVGGTAVEFNPVDATRVKDNLIRTKLNVDKLREAYGSTNNAVKRVSTLLSQKQMILATNIGAEFAFYSSSTYARMSRILEIIKPRIKAAVKMHAHLEKMRNAYERVVSELQNYSKKLGAISNMVYTTAYQRKVTNMYDSARYMTQIVTLRMTALAAYIRQLDDIQQMLISLNSINRRR